MSKKNVNVVPMCLNNATQFKRIRRDGVTRVNAAIMRDIGGCRGVTDAWVPAPC